MFARTSLCVKNTFNFFSQIFISIAKDISDYGFTDGIECALSRFDFWVCLTQQKISISWLFGLFLDRLIFNHDDKKEHKLYKFPAVKRDFDFVFKKGIKLKDVKQSIKNTSSLVIGNKDNTLANALVAHFGQESLSNVSSVRPGKHSIKCSIWYLF